MRNLCNSNFGSEKKVMKDLRNGSTRSTVWGLGSCADGIAEDLKIVLKKSMRAGGVVWPTTDEIKEALRDDNDKDKVADGSDSGRYKYITVSTIALYNIPSYWTRKYDFTHLTMSVERIHEILGRPGFPLRAPPTEQE